MKLPNTYNNHGASEYVATWGLIKITVAITNMPFANHLAPAHAFDVRTNVSNVFILFSKAWLFFG